MKKFVQLLKVGDRVVTNVGGDEILGTTQRVEFKISLNAWKYTVLWDSPLKGKPNDNQTTFSNGIITLGIIKLAKNGLERALDEI